MSERLNVDWRDGAGRYHVLIQRACAFLIAVDRRRFAIMESGETKSQGAVVGMEVDGIPMVVRMATNQKRLAREDARSLDFWGQVVAVLTEVIAMWQRKSDVQRRQFQYICQTQSISKAQISKMLTTLALTLRIHPLLLGVRPQHDAKIIIPKQMRLKFRQPKSMARFLVDGEVFLLTLKPGLFDVPDRIFTLLVEYPDSLEIHGVIVVEHRNFLEEEGWSEENLAGVIVIMIGGCPSFAVRELLHLLYKDPKLRNIPFWFFGDHDITACKLFTVLKFGANGAAWAVESMVCPSLKYGGPRVQDAYQSIEDNREERRAQESIRHPDWTSAELDKAVDLWVKNQKSYLHNHMSAPRANDKALWTSIEKLGLADLEPEMAREAQLILKHNQGFSMAKLQHGGFASLEIFIISKVKNIVVRPTANALDDPSSQRKRLDRASQAAHKQAHQVLGDMHLSHEELAMRSLELDMDA